MNVQETEFGKIEWEYPNVSEYFILLGKTGTPLSTLESSTESDRLVLMGKLVGHLGPYLKKIDLNINGKKVETFDELLKSFEIAGDLLEISGKLLMVMAEAQQKKG